MWQQIIVGILVVGAAIYAARKLGPRRWRQRAGNTPGAAGSCGCDKGGDGCH